MKVLDEILKDLNLTEENIEASRRTLERIGVSSSRSIWYKLLKKQKKYMVRTILLVMQGEDEKKR